MKYIITESQYNFLFESDTDNFLDNLDNILRDLLSDENFYNDLRDHSYNKYEREYWWKKSHEEMYEIAVENYCYLYTKLKKKYKLNFFVPFPSRNPYYNRISECKSFFRAFLYNHFRELSGGISYRGEDSPLKDQPYQLLDPDRKTSYYYEGPPWVPPYFMEVFGG
jgi:hypothetical protein